MYLSKFLDPKNDFCFKRLFGTEKHRGMLIHFINDVLGFKGEKAISSVEFLKTALEPETAAKKQSLVDVLCRDKQGHQYIIEMQVVRTTGFEKRAQYYAAKAYSYQLGKGEEYDTLRPVIFIAITDFVMFSHDPNYYSHHQVLNNETYSHDLQDFSFTFLELPKFNKGIEELKSVLDKWLYFFKHAEKTREEDIEKIVGDDAVILEAYQALNRFSMSEIELNTYEAAEKRERDERSVLVQKLRESRAEGKAEGLVEGMEKGKAEGEVVGQQKVALHMLQAGVSIEQIVQWTDLLEETVRELAEKMGNTN